VTENPRFPAVDRVLDRAAPRDQAHGLRQLFAGSRVAFVPLVQNPHVAFGGVAMERLCSAFGEQGLHTLVVDAADTATAPHELATVDLSACVEPLSASVSYLAARGLPMHHLDSRGTTGDFLDALIQAAPQAQVMLVHGGASELCRLFSRHATLPVLLAGNLPDSLTHAYGSMKLLAQRLDWRAFDLLLAAAAPPQRLKQLAERLADCADRFLGAACRHWAVADPASAADAPLPAALRRLAAARRQSLPLPAPSAASVQAVHAAFHRTAAVGRLN
jgi:hypothetical protein